MRHHEIKKQHLAIIFSILLYIPNISHANAEVKTDKERVEIKTSAKSKKIFIKNIQKIGDNEYSYQDSDNNVILVKCGKAKNKIRRWYFSNIGNETREEATNKMQWHSATGKFKIESDFICN